MKKLVSTVITLLLIFSMAYAQNSKDLYMPKDIKKAYEKGTRSYDGKPGKNYFQNKTDYKIKAEFTPETRILTGEEIINFQNNSPNNLSVLYIKLYQNLFKKGSARDWDIGFVDIHDGVKIKSLIVNGKKIDVNSKSVNVNSTLMRVRLSEKILPKSKNKIEIKWSLVIPGTVKIRMGAYNKTNFMISYWYPKISVYDDVSGWNVIPHKGNCEYYNDYGDFDVEITVPSIYTVWSSGLLQNPKEIYTKKYLKRIEKAAVSNEIIHVIAKGDREKSDITKKAEKHTWKFKATYMPDFAFALSNKYLWDATSVKVGNKRVLVHAVYKENSKDFHEVADISRKSIDYFSNKTPGIPYPYPQLVAFNGGGGMEFPGMINDGDARNRNRTINLTAHEIGHSYYPFYVGTNEQRYAWVDEGLITFFPKKIVGKYTNDKNYKLFADLVSKYNSTAGTANEIPLMVSSTNTGQAYRYHAYIRSSTAFYTLHELIGAEKFNKGLQEYTKRWNGKHPTPYDLFFTFNEIAGEDLAWFWKPWFFDLGYADLAIKKVNIKKKTSEIIIEKKGHFPVQINLKVIFKDGSTKKFSKPASIWKDGKKTFRFEIKKPDIKEVLLNNLLAPDAYGEDNVWTALHNISKKTMKSYVGKYGARNIILNNGELYYYRKGGSKMKMIAVDDIFFRFKELSYFRLKIIKKDEKVIAVEGYYNDGRKARNKKNK